MTFFDFAVRPEDRKPPLSQVFVLFGRISSTLAFNSLLFLTFHLYFFREYGVLAFIVYCFLLDITFIIDGLVSNSLGRNIENLRKAGYSDVTIFAYTQIALLGSQVIGFSIVNYICTDTDIYTLEHFFRNFGLDVIGKITINLTIFEVFFAMEHSLIHTQPKLAELHVFHHCANHSSWAANVLFHPIDIVIEFAGPAVVLLGLHFLLWKDQFTLLITYLIFLHWYTFDHDDTLQLYHYTHHTDCDSVYVPYSNVRGDPKKNLLRDKMYQMDLKWPTSVKQKKAT